MKRTAIRIAIASVLVSAAVGIYGMLAGGLGDLQARIMGTTATVALANVFALGSLGAWERRRLGALPPIAIAVSTAGFALLVVLIWTDGLPDWQWKAIATLLASGTALSHIAWLAPFNLARRYERVRTTSYVTGVALAAFVSTVVWFEPDDKGLERVGGVLLIVFAASTILVPLLQRYGAAGDGGMKAARPGFCPFCGEALHDAGDVTTCEGCGTRFAVRSAS